MAVQWNTQITNVNIQSKRANVRFTRKEPGDWADNTAYAVDDTIAYESIVYKCLAAHTSVRGAGIGLGGEPDTNTSQWQIEAGIIQDVFIQQYNSTPIAGDTPQETNDARLLILNTIWDAWQQEIAKRVNIDALVTNLEQAANTNLVNREP
jgi:hypothetical protein